MDVLLCRQLKNILSKRISFLQAFYFEYETGALPQQCILVLVFTLNDTMTLYIFNQP